MRFFKTLYDQLFSYFILLKTQIFSLISGIYDDDQEIITLSRSDFGMLISWWTRLVMTEKFKYLDTKLFMLQIEEEKVN